MKNKFLISNKMKSTLLKNKLFSLLLILQLAVIPNLFAQNIAINTTGNAPDTSAMLDITSTTQGLLMPRLTTAQMNAIVLPATGLLIYNTSLNVFEVNIGTSASPNWVPIATTQTGWNTIGNSNTNGGTNFLGTTDNHPLKIKVNNTLAGLIDSLGGSNTFLGLSAGAANTTGTQNTFIGNSAGSSAVSTASNVFVGNSAGSTSTGSYNTFMGSSSGNGNTTGTNNIFLGYLAGKGNTTGTYNTAIGSGAGGGSNNTGSSNIYIGSNAGSASNNSSGNNVLIGSSAGINSTSASNVFVGSQAGQSNTTGVNQFIGYNAGNQNTTGTRNTFMGYTSGQTNKTGNNITLVGYATDVLVDGLNNAAAIGYNAKVGSNNSFVIGDTASTANAVNVGVGVRYPLKRLHIDAAPVSSSSANDSLKIDHLASMTSANNKALLVIDSTTGYVGRENISMFSTAGQIMRFGINAQPINTGTEAALRFNNSASSANMGNTPGGVSNFINTINGASVTTGVSAAAGTGTLARTTDQVTLPAGLYKVVVRLDLSFAFTNISNNFYLKCVVNNNEYSLLDYTSDATATGSMEFEDFINITGSSQTLDFVTLSTTNNVTIKDQAVMGSGKSYRSLVLIQRLQ